MDYNIYMQLFLPFLPRFFSDLADFVKCHEPVFLYMLAKKNNAMRQQEFKRLERFVENGTRRIAELDKLFETAFERNVLGKLEDDRYERMVLSYEKEQKEKPLSPEAKEAKKFMQASYTCRMLLLVIVAILAISLPFINAVACLIVLLFPRITIYVTQMIRSKKEANAR